jgi:hypothetical protein
MARVLPTLPIRLQNARLQLPSGGHPLLRAIELDTATQSFFLGSFDISEFIPAGTQRYWPGFDLEAYNVFLSNRRMDAQGRYVSDLPESGTVKLWIDGMAEDVTTIAKEVRDAYARAGKAVKTAIVAPLENTANTASILTNPFVLIGGGLLALLIFKPKLF